MALDDGSAFSTNADQLAAAFAALAATLKEQIAPWNTLIVTEIEVAIRTLYGEKLAAYFLVENIVPETGQLAHVAAGSNDPFVLEYEFGTKPHEIWAHHTALKFTKNGELLYRRMVHHPGFAGKHLMADLEAQIQAACASNWADALTTVLYNFDSSF